VYPQPGFVLSHAHNQIRNLLHDPWPPRPAPVHEIPLLGNQPSMPAQQSIGRNERSLCIGEPDSPPTQPVFKQSVFGLEKLDDDQLVAMNPTSRDHQQKREQRWHGTHAPVYRTPRLNCWTLRERNPRY
jgi:hypothetical protein